MEEASRYRVLPLCWLAVLDPLRVILADVFGFLCKDLGVDEEVIDDLLERTIQKVLEEGEEAGTI